MNTIFRCILLLGFILAIGFAKFLLVWCAGIKSQASIFFNYDPRATDWYSYLFPTVFYIIQLLILLFLGVLGWAIVNLYMEISHNYLIEYNRVFFIALPLSTFWLLNSYFIYSYVGVFSSVDGEGVRGTPTTIEYPNKVFSKNDKEDIDIAITYLENDEHYEDEVNTRRFLFLETALINGFYYSGANFNGLGNYFYSLFLSLIEYLTVSVLYLFTPIVIYEFMLYKSQKRMAGRN